MREMKTAYKISVGDRKRREREFGIFWNRWKNNIKMDHKVMAYCDAG
jgi:hypothetical protein